MTASSPATWSRFSPPSHAVNGHMSTMWFMVHRKVIGRDPICAGEHRLCCTQNAGSAEDCITDALCVQQNSHYCDDSHLKDTLSILLCTDIVSVVTARLHEEPQKCFRHDHITQANTVYTTTTTTTATTTATTVTVL